MLVNPDRALDNAWRALDHASALAQSVLDLKRPRTKASPRLRDRIGRRDRWICCVCKGPIDNALTYIQPDKAAQKKYAEYLETLTQDAATKVLEWVQGDYDRAEAAYTWSLSRHRRTLEAARRRSLADFFAVANLDGPHDDFREALRMVIRERRDHNKHVATLEHLRPVSIGGDESEDNLGIAHRGCNTHYGAPGATNAHLLDAPHVARNLIEGIDALRDARPVSAELLAHYVDHLSEALSACGLRDGQEENIRADLLLYVPIVAEHFRPLWTARQACMALVVGLARTEAPELIRRLKRELRAIDKKVETLKRASAIERWQAKRRVAAAALSHLRERPDFYEHLRRELSRIPGQQHDAAWWHAQHEALPPIVEPSLWGDWSLYELRVRETCIFCRRRERTTEAAP